MNLSDCYQGSAKATKRPNGRHSSRKNDPRVPSVGSVPQHRPSQPSTPKRFQIESATGSGSVPLGNSSSVPLAQ